jgi:5-methylcytosine-specific restriction endonuclease McrA
LLKTTARKLFKDAKRWTDLHELYEKQNGLCAVTNLPIAFGKNASIDHVIPQNRGGSHNMNNLRWVHIVVNRMKNDMTDGELLEWVYVLVESKHRLQVGPPCDLNAPAGRTHSWPLRTTI